MVNNRHLPEQFAILISMRLKLIAVFSLFFLLTAYTTKSILASEKPSDEITASEEVYADLALRNELQNVSVYYFDDNIGNTISLNAEKDWVPASTIKLFAAMYAYDQVATGNISLEQTVTITDNNVAPSLSDPNGYPPLSEGDTVTVYRLVDQMITQSDNTSFNTLLDLLDRRQITKYIHDLGLVNSSVGGKLNLNDSEQAVESASPGYGPNVTTADDYAKAFILINGGRIPGSTGLFNILSRQKLNSMIPSLLPKNVIVAHKTGELDPYYHDGGIIVTPENKKYILSVFSDLGDPSVVAHISDLVYTKDINLVGSAQDTKPASSETLPPVDPLVTSGIPQNANVLAESTQNIKAPTVTASDLGMKSQDLSSAIDISNLPKVIIPPGSPLHFLIDIEEKLIALNPIPQLRVSSEVSGLKLKLAEANSLLSNGKKDEATLEIKQIGIRLSELAQDKTVAQNQNLQLAIDQVSQTRFLLFQKNLSSLRGSDKIKLIKTIAQEAKNTSEKILPFVAEAVKAKDLAEKPIVGQVVRTTPTSVTVKTSEGQEVTTALDSQIKTRDVSSQVINIENVSKIKIGTTIALAGGSSDKKIKPSFILTNIPSGSENPRVVTVLKVNLDTNTMVVAGSNGIPLQVNITSNSVIKGIDTKISLNEVKTGDVVIVRGEEVSPKPQEVSTTPAPTSASNKGGESSKQGQPSNNGNQPSSGQGNQSQTSNTNTTNITNQSSTTQKTTAPAAKGGEVIKGTVIQVVEKSSEEKRTKPKEEKKIPNPIPSATPAEKEKK